MATSIHQGFSELQRNLNITSIQESTLAERQQNIRRVLESEFIVVDTFVMGSYRRHTIIAPLSKADVDIFVVLDHRYFERSGPYPILERIRERLRAANLPSGIRPDAPAVTVTFDDFKVDVVPGFNRPVDGYLIPDPSLKGWLPTNPKKHIEIWSRENEQHAGKLVPLLKMVKGWNNKHRRSLRSFHLETMSLQFVRGVEIADYSLAVGYVFDKARVKVKLPTQDEAGYGGNVGNYLDTQAKMSAATSALEAVYAGSIEATEMESRGMTFEAFQQWRVIFGDYFPTYG
jgi:hypothetical protein